MGRRQIDGLPDRVYNSLKFPDLTALEQEKLWRGPHVAASTGILMIAYIRRLCLLCMFAFLSLSPLTLSAQDFDYEKLEKQQQTPAAKAPAPAPAAAPEKQTSPDPAPAKKMNWPSASHPKTESEAETPEARNGDAKAPAAPAPSGAGKPAQNGSEEVKPDTPPSEGSNGAAGASDNTEGVPPVVQEMPAVIATGMQQAEGLTSRIQALEKTVERVRDRDKDLNEQLSAIDAVIVAAQRHANELKPRLEDVKSLISRLGPVPDGKTVPTESASIAAQRARLNAVAAEIDGAIKQSSLVEVRARQLSGRVQELRQEIFTRELLQRSRSSLTREFWQEIWQTAPGTRLQVIAIASGWWATVATKLPAASAVVFASFLLYVLLKLGTVRLLRSLVASPVPQRGFYLKVSMAGAQVPLRALPSIAAAGALYLGLDLLGLMYLQVGQLSVRMLEAFVTYKIAASMATAYLQPKEPSWRVMEVDDSTAGRLSGLIKAIAAVYAVDLVARELIRLLYLPLPVSIVTTMITSILFPILMVLIARLKFPLSVGTDNQMARFKAELLKLPLLLAAILIILALLGGYVALARYLSLQVLATGAAVVLLLVFYLANRAIAVEPDQNPAAKLSAKDPHGIPLDLRRRISGITAIVLDVVLAVIAIPVLLISFGFSKADISSITNRALFGFEIGGMQISLARIAIAVGLFVGLLIATRVLRRWLSESILSPKRADQGLSNSISTGINYLGIAIAALAAVSYAGLDITNIALVAGALSVGIGFGLQSIVNNFVSGLILLVERPVKVGDWINVAGQGGYVRRISVRSTEIETFDRASVILPNSELITGTVVNMTHRNAIGRLVLPVRVPYGTDPEKVIALLMKVAEDSPLVAKHPAPSVPLEAFGDNGLEFSLRAFIVDVNRSVSTATELRVDIVKAFAKEGLVFAHPLRRDLEAESPIAAIMEEHRSAAETDDGVEDENETAPK